MNILIGLLATIIVLTSLLIISACVYSGMLGEKESTATRPNRPAIVHLSHLWLEPATGEPVTPLPARPRRPELLPPGIELTG